MDGKTSARHPELDQDLWGILFGLGAHPASLYLKQVAFVFFQIELLFSLEYVYTIKENEYGTMRPRWRNKLEFKMKENFSEES